jgi:hypothetical protein
VCSNEARKREQELATGNAVNITTQQIMACRCRLRDQSTLLTKRQRLKRDYDGHRICCRLK